MATQDIQPDTIVAFTCRLPAASVLGLDLLAEFHSTNRGGARVTRTDLIREAVQRHLEAHQVRLTEGGEIIAEEIPSDADAAA